MYDKEFWNERYKSSQYLYGTEAMNRTGKFRKATSKQYWRPQRYRHAYEC